MENIIFKGKAHVALQGEQALRLLKRNGNCAEYEVLGFRDVPITLRDYRPEGLEALNLVEGGGDEREFAIRFNHPASITVATRDGSGLEINLRKTDDPDPCHTLWVAVGWQEGIPLYDYVYHRIEPIDSSHLAFLSVYRHPNS